MTEASTLAPTVSNTSCFGPADSVRTGGSVFSVVMGTPFGEVDSAMLGSAGVALDGVATDCRSRSRFFSSVRRKAFKVVRRALLGLQRSGATGVWVQTGHVLDSEAWPRARKLTIVRHGRERERAFPRTSITDGLVTARETESIQGQIVADGASKLEGNLVLGQGAGKQVII